MLRTIAILSVQNTWPMRLLPDSPSAIVRWDYHPDPNRGMYGNWCCSGRITYYTEAPETYTRSSHVTAEIVSEMSAAFDIESLVTQEQTTLQGISSMPLTTTVSTTTTTSTINCVTAPVGLFRGLHLPPTWRWKNVVFYNVKKYYAKFWVLLKMYAWNVPPGTPPFSDF